MSAPAARAIDIASRFPPSFDDNPWSYGYALFSLALITSISLAFLIGWGLEHRREAEINRIIRNQAHPPRRHGLTLLGLYRLLVSGLLLTIVFGAMPDVLVLLAWGEASDNTMWLLFEIDRAMDGAASLPFLFFVILSIRAAPVVDHVIGIDPVKVSLRPTWGMVRDKLKIVGMVLCIAAGVTFYKAGSL
jgi:hypothetical protein